MIKPKYSEGQVVYTSCGYGYIVSYEQKIKTLFEQLNKKKQEEDQALKAQ